MKVTRSFIFSALMALTLSRQASASQIPSPKEALLISHNLIEELNSEVLNQLSDVAISSESKSEILRSAQDKINSVSSLVDKIVSESSSDESDGVQKDLVLLQFDISGCMRFLELMRSQNAL